MRLQKQIDKQSFDLRFILDDPVIARRRCPAELEPVEGALASKRRAILATRFELARQHRHCRIMAQLLMVDEILITNAMPNIRWPTRVANQLRRGCPKSSRQTDRSAESHNPWRPAAALLRDFPTVKSRNHCATFYPYKTEQIALHSVCIGLPSILRQTVAPTRFSQIQDPDALSRVRYPG
jgi:hypothetical protein